MILSKEVKVKIPTEFTSEYIENELKSQGYDVLRWAITDFDETTYTLHISYVKD